jgi:hypothetical protein
MAQAVCWKHTHPRCVGGGGVRKRSVNGGMDGVRRSEEDDDGDDKEKKTGA